MASALSGSTAGRPLDATTRDFFEPRFHQDFSQVRVHTGGAAASSAEALAARAYTAGHDIVFANGQYAPHSSAGQRLLAHELTHVVQQRASGPRLDRYEETTEPQGIVRDVAPGLLLGPVLNATCFSQLEKPMKALTFGQWIGATCLAQGNVGALHARDWDAFGHCWMACEGSRRCGTFATAELGIARELGREYLYGGPHDSFKQDTANQATGRDLSHSPGRCYTLCDAAYRARRLDLSAPVRTCVNCANQADGESAANCSP